MLLRPARRVVGDGGGQAQATHQVEGALHELAGAGAVLVDAEGRRPERAAVPMAVRRARSVRISVDGNAHFCRGLLTTRYPGSEADQTPRPEDRPLLPLTVSSTSPFRMRTRNGTAVTS